MRKGDEAMFEVFVGHNKEASHQQPFAKQVDCPHCRSTARIALTSLEGATPNTGPRVSDLHLNQKDAFWPHDSIAFAIYFCKKCGIATVLWNQA